MFKRSSLTWYITLPVVLLALIVASQSKDECRPRPSNMLSARGKVREE